MKVLLLSGEESGVMYAERIRHAVLRRWPEAEIRGYEDYGFKTADLAVMGFSQVLVRILYFLRVKRMMEKAISEWQPDVVCTVDYPGMNLKLAAYAKKRGCRTVHVVCPQVWAWRVGRISKIEAALDCLCCFFPFEPPLFHPGFATFVGHPLIEEFSRAKREVPFQKSVRTLAVLPGSRMGEIAKHLPTLLEAIVLLREQAWSSGLSINVLIPAANDRAFRKITDELERVRQRLSGITVLHGRAREALSKADAAVVASGTATLEAALTGCPTVLVYKVGWLFAAIARRVIKGIKHVGLANVIAEKAGRACPMDELLQENFTASAVAEKLTPLLSNSSANAAARSLLFDTMELIESGGNALERVVDCFTQ